MIPFLVVFCFIAPCLSAPTNETSESEPALTLNDFKNRIEASFRDWRANYERRKPFASLNKPKNCFSVEKPELNLNFTCVETNITISMKPEDVQVLLNNTELVVNAQLEFEIFIDTKIEVIGDINGTKVEKNGFMKTVVPKLINNLNSTYIYKDPYITGALIHQHSMDIPKFIVTVKDIDISQEIIEVAQNTIQSNLKVAFDKAFQTEVRMVKQRDLLNEINEALRVKPVTLESVLLDIEKYNDPTVIFA